MGRDGTQKRNPRWLGCLAPTTTVPVTKIRKRIPPMFEPNPLMTFDDLPDFLRRIVDQVADAIIKAGRSPAEAVEPARAVRKLFDQPGDALSAYSRETLDRAASLMEAEILRRVAAAQEERALIVLTLDDLLPDLRTAVEDFACAILAARMTPEEAANAARRAREIVERKAEAQSSQGLRLRAIAATIVEPDETRIDAAGLADLTSGVLPVVGAMVESEILRRVCEARGAGPGGTA